MKTLAEHNRRIAERDDMLRNASLAGVACDHCGEPMVYENKTSVAGTGQHVRCPKCDARGFKRS